MSPVGENLLIAGTSGSGKSTLAHAILEQLIDKGYQTCVIDPEGDYQSIEKMIMFGNAQRGPTVAEVLTAMDNPEAQVIVNLVGLPLKDRPSFFLELLPLLQERRNRTGRPHRVLVDETHHLLPTKWRANGESMRDLKGMLFVTVHPDQVSPHVLDTVDIAVALGERPSATLEVVAKHKGLSLPHITHAELKSGEGLLWRAASEQSPDTFHDDGFSHGTPTASAKIRRRRTAS